MSGVLSPTQRACKVCGQSVSVRHAVQQIPYCYCPDCNFLQTFYWEDHPGTPAEAVANDKRRGECWPAGSPSHMRDKGWQVLQLMAWPPAWQARRLNTLLHLLPGYTPLVRRYVKRKLQRTLDFGCGHGMTVRQLRTHDGMDVVGLDPYSPIEHPSIARMTIFNAAYPDNTFNGIFAIETMEHITNPLPVFAELRRILKPNGVLLVQTRRLEDPQYLRDQEKWFYLEDPTTHSSIYSEEAMRQIAQRVGFSAVAFKGVNFAKFVK